MSVIRMRSAGGSPSWLPQRALQAGCSSTMEAADQFYGNQNAGIKDPCGNIWWIATHKEDVAPEEMKRRAEAMMKQRHAG